MLFYIFGTTMATIAALIVILFVCIIIDRRIENGERETDQDVDNRKR